MTKIELIFIPSPGIGHLRPIVKLAKQLITTDTRLSILVIIIPSATDTTSDTTNTYISQDRLRYQSIIPVIEQPQNTNLEPGQVYIEKQKQKVKETVANTIDPTKKLGCFVVDMFCCSMIDVANEFKVPCYMIYTSNATFLGITLHVQELYDEKKYDTSDLDESVKELEFPCLTRPYPVKCLPHILVSKEWLPFILNLARYFRKMEGILVNTVAELEPQALKMFTGGLGFGLPKAYPVGPVLHLENDSDENHTEILRWLDDQPPKSVVFLCFGSMGGFTEEQAREVAVALERSGHRFLWSLRRASSNLLTEKPGEFTDLEEVLPGFLDRTLERGKVIGWAPQVAVLAKPAIGGFVTHCGWNSMLEGLWFGVPMVAWPLYAEQKVNAFEMVEELGLAVEIRKCIGGDLVAQGGLEMVTAEEIERAIRCVMEQDSDVRKRVKEMAEKCHVALVEGGSSHVALQKFIQDVTKHVT